MAFTAPSGTPIVVGRLKKPEAVFMGGPEHAISYTWQLASNVAIIYPDSRFFGHVDWICKHDWPTFEDLSANPGRSWTQVADSSYRRRTRSVRSVFHLLGRPSPSVRVRKLRRFMMGDLRTVCFGGSNHGTDFDIF
jgi:hypothetical protein